MNWTRNYPSVFNCMITQFMTEYSIIHVRFLAIVAFEAPISKSISAMRQPTGAGVQSVSEGGVSRPENATHVSGVVAFRAIFLSY
jgi:hypothetical protein